MTGGYSTARQRIHDRANNFFTVARFSTEQRTRFFGATDALLDVDISASHFSEGVRAAPMSGLLLCYGFLQALYVQQEAVTTLSRAVGLRNWKPDDVPELLEIRDIRNRLIGHPNETGAKEGKRPRSSAIINSHDIRENGFVGHVYYEGRFDRIEVDAEKFLRINTEKLCVQLEAIEAKMDKDEQGFRNKHSVDRFSNCFNSGFAYLRQKLWCTLGDDIGIVQAQSHAEMIKDVLENLQLRLNSKGFTTEANNENFIKLRYGLDKLESIMIDNAPLLERQYLFDLLYSGIESVIEELIRTVRDLDLRLSQGIP
jgi:hypothetical protein